jgi:exopolysaccharide biosynthesis predicted pyruvyltransferase EpsI
MQFTFTIVWRELEEHSSANTTGITFKFKHTMKYPDFPSAMKPVPQSAELFVSKLLLIFSIDKSDSDEDREQQERKNVDSV